jgi:hypothetical protein
VLMTPMTKQKIAGSLRTSLPPVAASMAHKMAVTKNETAAQKAAVCLVFPRKSRAQSKT